MRPILSSLLLAALLPLWGLPQGKRAPLPRPAAPVGVTDVPVQSTSEPPMLRGDTPATSNGWAVTPLLTISEAVGGYRPPGLLDGVGAFRRSATSAVVLVNHELKARDGTPYALANGTVLTGARISRFTLRRNAAGEVSLQQGGLAYAAIYDRQGSPVTDPLQVNETGKAQSGLTRLCSGQAVEAGSYGFVDAIFFAGEEASKPSHPHGGTEWALDAERGELWAVPAIGRGSWENATPLETGDPGRVALLLGSDEERAPLFLYVGTRGTSDGFLGRNGLEVGTLHAWRTDNGDADPEAFHGLNEARTGHWVPLQVRDPARAGQPGYDALGYLDHDTLQAQALGLGCFSFSRPEDVDTNPRDGTQAVLDSTGRGSVYPSDNWGTIYVLDVDVGALTADVVIVHDADDLPNPDDGIRSPDNVAWSANGKLYVQEDRSTSPASLFGATNGTEASVWELDPVTRAITRIAEVDRSAVAPAGSSDGCAGDLGCWETSGVLDVTGLLPGAPGERLLLGTVQAHGIQDGPIGGKRNLVQGGQLVLLSRAPR